MVTDIMAMTVTVVVTMVGQSTTSNCNDIVVCFLLLILYVPIK